MHFHCPQCDSGIESVDASECPSCGGTLTRLDDETARPVSQRTAGELWEDNAATLSYDAIDPDAPTVSPTNPKTVGQKKGGDLRDASALQFGEYELLDEIARGGMGVVYRARQTKANRIVALKMILGGQMAGADDIKRFYAEAEAAANLDHSNIVPIFDVGEFDGQHYFSMSYIEGQSLKDYTKDGPIPPREAARLVQTIAEAVAFAHSQGVIHRDLKPANILLDADKNPRITDFGVAKKLGTDSDLTSSGQVLGTPSYMPPEQASGNIEQIGPASDVYSIGAILYDLLTGRPPFQAATVVETLRQVVEFEPIPPGQLNHEVGPDLEAICMKCLAKQPGDRYLSAQDLAADLTRYLDGRVVHAKPVSTLALARRVILNETRHQEVMSKWGHVWLWHAGLTFALFALTNLLLWSQITAVWPFAALWSVGVATLIAVVWYYRLRAGLPLTPIERQIGAIWGMFIVVAITTSIINHLLGLETMLLLPIVVLECGFAIGAMATILGGSFYPLAFACGVCAVVMSILPSIGPVVFGVVFAIGLLYPGWKYSRPTASV